MDLPFATATVSAHSKLGVSAEYIQQIVAEEQCLRDSGVDRVALMARSRQADREKYKSARERLEQRRRHEMEHEREFYRQQAAGKDPREHRMPPT